MEFDTIEDYKPEEDTEFAKGITRHANGGISWINPEFLDKDSSFDGSQLPF